MLSTHPGERTSAPQTSFRPDLLPSGLYRRPRSFTGSWGLQAFFALSADCTGYLDYPLACRFAFPDFPALGRALRTTPRGLYRRLGIGKARIQVLSSPCPEGRALTQRILTLRRCETQDSFFDIGHCLSERSEESRSEYSPTRITPDGHSRENLALATALCDLRVLCAFA
jgi:hypothetical protein